ncbi:MAG: basic amino acid ABC transporter substrate-binding protein [Neisseria sp.]|uniref:basic amino acid ABC transporter substrate-binding protein n=1 Tax=Neisseria sp. TaxID=192066 RepID=UPI0026DD9C92|nr:basic amino acid ABC transporter substrate-binding protein [Neisseria sp.]MDO4640233.1 basic amino acid ABC transporter substrate-binding protein [Neisseria sp.]
MSMRKWLGAVCVCSALVLSGCGGQDKEHGGQASAAGSDKVYRVAMNAEFAPFESLDNNNHVEGFDVDLMNAMAAAGNFKVEYKHQPWDSLFAALGNGDVDILASAITITDERKQTMSFTDPYYKITQVILVPSGKNIKNVADLKNANKVGVVTGQTGDFAITKMLGNGSSKIARFDTLPLVIKEMESGGLDAVVTDSAVVGNYLKNNPGKGFTVVEAPDFTVENYGFAVRQGDNATLDMLNAALKKVRENGEYEKIESKYFAK